MLPTAVVLLAALPALGGPADRASPTTSAAPAQPADDRTLREADQALARALETSDREAFAALLAADAVSLLDGRAHEGRAAVLEFWAEYLDPAGPRLRWTTELAELSRSGDLGYTIGRYRIQEGSAEEPASEGRYVTVWRRDPDGVFRAAAGAPLLPPSDGGPRVARIARRTLSSRATDLVVEIGTWTSMGSAVRAGQYLSVRRRTREGSLAPALETLVPSRRRGD